MNFFSTIASEIVEKIYPNTTKLNQNQSDDNVNANNKIYVDIESQYIIRTNNYAEMNKKSHFNKIYFKSGFKHEVKTRFTNVFIDDSMDEINSNNLIMGSGYDGYNSMEWTRETIEDDYKVLYKGKKYTISYLDVIEIMNRTNNKACSIDKILKIYIENNFNINLTIIQLAV